MKTIGAYFQAYRNVKATEFVIKNFLKNFSNSPIFLISDGGSDFNDLSKKYGCGYVYLNNIYGNEINKFPTCPYDKKRMKEAWKRHKMAVDYCQTDYIMILEDDVLINNSFEIEEDFSLCGVNGPRLSRTIKEIVKKNNGCISEIYGMCGGSIYNSKIFSSIFDDVMLDIEHNHDSLLKDYNNYVLGAIDASLTFHFNKRGFCYKVSPWLSQVCDGEQCMNFPLVHQYKALY